MEQVRLCVYCGHLNNVVGGSRCKNCWLSLSSARLLFRNEAEEMARQRRFRYLRIRIIRRSLLVIIILSLVSWLIIAQNDLSSVIWAPDAATTNLNANTEDDSWSQFRNGVNNTGYVSDNSPTPDKILWTFKSFKQFKHKLYKSGSF